MNETLLIVTDLEHFKAFNVQERKRSGRIDLVALTSFDNIAPHKKLSDTVSDRSGRFRGLGGNGTAAYNSGDPNNIIEETKKRTARNIADQVNSLLLKRNAGEWYFAAPKKLNGEILGGIRPELMGRLKKNILLDLTKLPAERIVHSFFSSR